MMFYKNMFFTMIGFWFQANSGFSGYIPFDNYYIMFFNLFYCNASTLVLGALDYDIGQQFAMNVPQLYQKGIHQLGYSLKSFLIHNLDAIFQSLICYFIPVWIFYDSATSNSGSGESWLITGAVSGLTGVILANFYVGLNFYAHTWFSIGSILFGILVAIIFTVVGNSDSYDSDNTQLSGSLSEIFSTPGLYFGMCLIILVSISPKMLLRYIRIQFHPSDYDIVREVESYNVKTAALFESTRRRGTAPITGTSESGISGLLKEPERTWTKTPAVQLPSLGEPEQVEMPEMLPTKKIPRTLTIGKRLRDIGARKASSSLLYMRTGKFEKIRGFAFSQEEGMRNVLTGKAFGQMVLQNRPELEIKRLPQVALRDVHRYPRIHSEQTSVMGSSIQTLGATQTAPIPRSRSHAGDLGALLGIIPTSNNTTTTGFGSGLTNSTMQRRSSSSTPNMTEKGNGIGRSTTTKKK
jgi:phospholipid-translocating ATPase